MGVRGTKTAQSALESTFIDPPPHILNIEHLVTELRQIPVETSSKKHIAEEKH